MLPHTKACANCRNTKSSARGMTKKRRNWNNTGKRARISNMRSGRIWYSFNIRIWMHLSAQISRESLEPSDNVFNYFYGTGTGNLSRRDPGSFEGAAAGWWFLRADVGLRERDSMYYKLNTFLNCLIEAEGHDQGKSEKGWKSHKRMVWRASEQGGRIFADGSSVFEVLSCSLRTEWL